MAFRALRSALIANAVFSTSCALALLGAGSTIAPILEPIPPWLLTSIGVGLLAFAVLIVLVAIWPRISGALVISGMDALWVLATVPVALFPGLLTVQGSVIVMSVAVIVGVVAAMQLRGVRRLLRAGADEAGSERLCVRIESPANPDALWHTIYDLGSIARYSPGLKASHLEGSSEPVAGAVRVCTNARDQSWGEEVLTLDEHDRSVVLRFRAEAPDFPFPLKSLIGGWRVEPTAVGTSAVEVWWTMEPKASRFGWLVVAVMSIPLIRGMRHTVAAMGQGAQEGESITPSRGLPNFTYC